MSECEHDGTDLGCVHVETGPRLCHQCGTLHVIPEGAICLKAAPEVQQEVLRIAMRAGITEEWVRENLIPIRRIIRSLTEPELNLSRIEHCRENG